MSMLRGDLIIRLRALDGSGALPADVKERHLAVLTDAVISAGPPIVRLPVRHRLRWAAASVAAAATALGPAALAASSSDALPGDALYPVKLVTERVGGLFNDDLEARHRLEELEALIEAGRLDEARGLLPNAVEAVEQLEVDDDLNAILSDLRLRLDTEETGDGIQSEPVPAGEEGNNGSDDQQPALPYQEDQDDLEEMDDDQEVSHDQEAPDDDASDEDKDEHDGKDDNDDHEGEGGGEDESDESEDEK
jgi:hypothetical protein